MQVAQIIGAGQKLSRKNIPHAQAKTLIIEGRNKRPLAKERLNRIDMDALKTMVR